MTVALHIFLGFLIARGIIKIVARDVKKIKDEYKRDDK